MNPPVCISWDFLHHQASTASCLTLHLSPCFCFVPCALCFVCALSVCFVLCVCVRDVQTCASLPSSIWTSTQKHTQTHDSIFDIKPNTNPDTMNFAILSSVWHVCSFVHSFESSLDIQPDTKTNTEFQNFANVSSVLHHSIIHLLSSNLD